MYLFRVQTNNLGPIFKKIILAELKKIIVKSAIVHDELNFLLILRSHSNHVLILSHLEKIFNQNI